MNILATFRGKRGGIGSEIFLKRPMGFLLRKHPLDVIILLR